MFDDAGTNAVLLSPLSLHLSPTQVQTACSNLWQRCASPPFYPNALTNPSASRLPPSTSNGPTTHPHHLARFDDKDAPPHLRVGPFHSISVPSVPLHRMITALQGRVAHQPECLSIAFTLLLRYERLTGCVATHLTAHRLLATALLLAMKLHQEQSWSNKQFAVACGIPLSDLNRMEVSFCLAVNFELHVSRSQVSAAVQEVMAPSPRPLFAPPPLAAPLRLLETPATTSSPFTHDVEGPSAYVADFFCPPSSSSTDEDLLHLMCRGGGGVATRRPSSWSDMKDFALPRFDVSLSTTNFVVFATAGS